MFLSSPSTFSLVCLSRFYCLLRFEIEARVGEVAMMSAPRSSSPQRDAQREVSNSSCNLQVGGVSVVIFDFVVIIFGVGGHARKCSGPS